MQLQKVYMSIVLILVLLPCRDGQGQLVMEREDRKVSVYIEQGKEKLSAGDYAGAIADLDKALQIAPEHPDAYYARASAKFELGKSQQGQGEVEQAKRTYRSAIEDYAQVITLAPEHPGAYIFGGSVHLRLAGLADAEGDSQQAEHHYHAVHKMGSHLTDLEPENASGWRTRGAAKHHLGMLAAARGNREQAQRHYEDGIEAYTQAVAFGPANPAAYAARGEVHVSLGILEMVRDHIQQAQFHYESGIADHKQAVFLSPPEYTTIFSPALNKARVRLGESEVARGNIEQAQFHYQAAIEGFDEAIGIDPGESLGNIAPRDVFTALVYNDRAEAKHRLGASETLTGNVEQAEHHYREAIADCDQVLAAMHKVEAFYTRGRVKAALTDYTGAIADFDAAIGIKSDYALAYYARGSRNRQGGNPTQEMAWNWI